MVLELGQVHKQRARFWAGLLLKPPQAHSRTCQASLYGVHYLKDLLIARCAGDDLLIRRAPRPPSQDARRIQSIPPTLTSLSPRCRTNSLGLHLHCEQEARILHKTYCTMT